VKVFEYSWHALSKFELSEIKKLKIDKEHVEKVIRKPKVIDKIDKPVLMAIGELNKTLSLCVLYKKAKQGIRIITFFPAEKGRYEYKILQGR